MPKSLFNSKSFKICLDPQKVWEYIEMGKDIDDLYPDEFKTENVIIKNSKLAEEILLEGEQYTFVEHSHGDYIITSFARIYNFKHNRFVIPYTKSVKHTKDIYVTIRNEKLSLRELFKQQGWEFNVDELSKRYIKSTKGD